MQRKTEKEQRKIKKAFEKCYERYGWYGVYEELKRKGYKRSFSGMVYAAKRMGLKEKRTKKSPRKQARRYPELLMPGEKVQIDVKEVSYSRTIVCEAMRSNMEGVFINGRQ